MLDALQYAEFLLRKAAINPNELKESFARAANDARNAMAKAHGMRKRAATETAKQRG